MSDFLPEAAQIEWIAWNDWIDWSAGQDDAALDRLPVTTSLEIDEGCREDHHRTCEAGYDEVDFEELSSISSMPDPDVNLIECTETHRSPLVNESPHAFEDHSHSEIERISTSSDKKFNCSFARCDSAFTRKSDLQRHINAKHNRTRTLLCPVKGCFRKQEQRSFSRADKLIAHLRTMHDAHSLGECSNESCRGADPLALIELHFHRQYVHGRWMEFGNYGKDYHLPAWYCPLTACTVHKSQASLYDHIFEHLQNGDLARFEVAADALQKKNLQLAVVGFDSRYSDHDHQSMQEHASSQVMGIHIVCPVCQLYCSGREEFETHMIETHLVESSKQEHFRAWMAEWKPRFSPLSFWCSRESTEQRSENPRKHVTCPVCGYVEQHLFSSHHWEMLRTELSYLKPYRVEIAELYPGFATEAGWKPVWDDLKAPLRKTSEGNSGASPN